MTALAAPAAPADIDLSGLRYIATVVPAQRTGDYPSVKITIEGVDVDRRDFHGYACSSLAIARRMADAVNAQRVFYHPAVRTDVNGKTFVHAASHVLGRMMNADLRRLGF